MQKSCFKCGRSWPHRNNECTQQKGKFVENAEKQIISPNFISLVILMLLIMKMPIL